MELNPGDEQIILNYQIYVSDVAWKAFPKWGRSRLLARIPIDFAAAQPTAMLRTRRCLRLPIGVAAKLEVIARVNKIKNPWSPYSTGNMYGSGKLGLAVEAIGQMIAKKGAIL